MDVYEFFDKLFDVGAVIAFIFLGVFVPMFISSMNYSDRAEKNREIMARKTQMQNELIDEWREQIGKDFTKLIQFLKKIFKRG